MVDPQERYANSYGLPVWFCLFTEVLFHFKWRKRYRKLGVTIVDVEDHVAMLLRHAEKSMALFNADFEPNFIERFMLNQMKRYRDRLARDLKLVRELHIQEYGEASVSVDVAALEQQAAEQLAAEKTEE